MGLKEYTKLRPTGPERFRKEYTRSFLEAVHAVLFAAVKRLQRRALTGFDEVAITGELVRELNAVVQSPRAPTRGFFLSIHDDPPVGTGVNTGKRRPRVDIQIEKVSPGPRIRFSFEAKRLRKSSARSRAAYIGEDGLGCFVSGRYAAHAPWAGMLGYVESGVMKDWMTSVGSAIAQTESLECFIEKHWSSPDFRFQHAPCRYSRHRRQGQADILIYHSFLDLRAAVARVRRKRPRRAVRSA
jgi:hypothetical protein